MDLQGGGTHGEQAEEEVTARTGASKWSQAVEREMPWPLDMNHAVLKPVHCDLPLDDLQEEEEIKRVQDYLDQADMELEAARLLLEEKEDSDVDVEKIVPERNVVEVLIEQNNLTDDVLVMVREDSQGEEDRRVQHQLEADTEEVRTLLLSSGSKVVNIDRQTIIDHLNFFAGDPSRVRSTVAELTVQRQDSPESPVIVREVYRAEGRGQKGKGRGKNSRLGEEGEGGLGISRRLELDEEEDKPAKRKRLQLGEDPEGRTLDAARDTPEAPGRQDDVMGRDQAVAGPGQGSQAAGGKDNKTAAKVESEELQHLVRPGWSEEGIGPAPAIAAAGPLPAQAPQKVAVREPLVVEFSEEVREMAHTVSEMFPTTPLAYLLHRCQDLVVRNFTLERLIAELVTNPEPPRGWRPEVELPQEEQEQGQEEPGPSCSIKETECKLSPLQVWEREKFEQLLSMFPEVCPDYLQAAVDRIVEVGGGQREGGGGINGVDNAHFQVSCCLQTNMGQSNLYP